MKHLIDLSIYSIIIFCARCSGQITASFQPKPLTIPIQRKNIHPRGVSWDKGTLGTGINLPEQHI